MRVASDPAEVVVNHVSFRVQLPGAAVPRSTSFEDTAPLPTVSPAAVAAGVGAGAGAGGARRRAPVVWSGKTAPGATVPTELLRAVPASGAPPAGTAPGPQAPATPPVPPGGNAGQTRVLPRVHRTDTGSTPTVASPRAPEPEEPAATDAVRETGERPLLSGVRPARGAFDEEDPFDTGESAVVQDVGAHAAAPHRRATQRQAFYPGRRMNLGVVLLPLRIFLGLISLYAGMGKLCDPVYFDGGERGSMVGWLRSLEPWTVAEPLREFALAHPVGAGLTVAFLQVIVGVLTVCGLWQRAAAGLGALLSAALLLTVSWRTVPAYDAPDLLYLAAWSPLLIAGAPVYSLDARLAGEAWRRLGPRVEVGVLRQRVLRRGAVIATVVVGLTLLVGSLLGGAVRSTQEVTTVPDNGETPTNQLPGSPLPQHSGRSERDQPATQGPQGTATGAPGASPREDAKNRQHQRPRATNETTGPESSPAQSAPPQQEPQRSAPQQQETPVQPSAGGQTSGPGTAPDSSASAGSGQGAEREPDSGDGGASSPEGEESKGGSGALGGLLGR